jgi:N-acetylglucosamine-6-phosphate deacetylase
VETPKTSLLRNVEIYTPTRRIADGAILIRNGRIAWVGTREEAVPHSRGKRRPPPFASGPMKIIDGRGLIAAPGFIDIHFHGGRGADFMDATAAAAVRVLRTHLRKGTTSAVPTLMTAPHADILAAIRAVRTAAGTKGILPAVLGLHLEGPYISAEKRGAQPLAAVRPYAAREMRAYLRAAGEGGIRIMTLAPEAPGAAALIAFLTAHGIVAAAGHSNAGFAAAARGLRSGVSHGTHLFNAMTGLFHRDPGLAGALLLNDRASVELIADGQHLHPAVVETVLRLKPAGKVILVTDATRRAGLGSRPLRTEDGKLYGSTITLDAALRNVVHWTRRPLTEVLPLLTLNPARLLGVEKRKGRLARGCDADIVLLDRGLNVRRVFLGGREISSARKLEFET